MDKISFFNHLTLDLIPFWDKLTDKNNGGFYGYADYEGKIDEKADKSVILENRILWFYSRSYLLLKDKHLLDNADHAYFFFRNHSFDKEYGGVYWSTNYMGAPKDTIKHTYNMAFAIYALSAYYEATSNKEALDYALGIFHTIETKCKDEKGYLEAFDRKFSPVSNEHLSENGVLATRTMNTLLHVLESYTELYHVSKNERVKTALTNALMIFKNKIYNPKRKIVEVFLDDEYNTLIDLESYGHEIEASWLIKRACDTVGDDSLSLSFKPVIEALAESVYKRGMPKEKNSIYYECEKKKDLKKCAWWVEAEGVTGFYNAYQMTGNTTYLETSEKIWDFINNNIIDKNTGEWIEDYYYDGSTSKTQALVHAWKCPYHNGRMCIEMIERLTIKKPADNNITSSASNLYQYLLKVAEEKKVLFGHQNSTFIKISSKYDSDVREMTGDIPAILGIDSLALAGFEMDNTNQQNSLLKSIQAALLAAKENAIITLSAHMPNFSSSNIYKDEEGCWQFHKATFLDCKDKSNDVMKEILPGGKYHKVFTAYLDLIVAFAKELDKNNIPILFRPWHECNGNWFFWGSDNSKDTYINVFRYTKEYLSEKGVHNLLYVYSPNGPFGSIDEYMARYPGDDIIDILALDYYDDYKYKEPYREDYFNLLDTSSKIVYQASIKHGKIPAISEVGIRVSKDPSNTDLNGLLVNDNPMCGHDWFKRVGQIAINYHMPYYLVWGNFSKTNTYLPYYNEDNTPHEMVSDFMNFYLWENSIFAKDVKKD